MKFQLAVILFSLFSLAAAAEELNYHQWEQLNKLAGETQDRPSYLPNKMQPVTDPNGVVQQIINYNINELKKTNSTWKMLDTQWGGHQTIAAQAKGTEGTAKAPTTTFQVKPFETKAWIEFANRFKASYNYQVMSHTSEFLLSPKKAIFGLKVGYSYVITSVDQQNLLSVRYEW